MEVKKWRCTVCGVEFEGENPPEVCPVCSVGSELFVEVKAEKSVTANIKEEEKKELSGKVWRCTVCDEVFPYDECPDTCPVCGVGKDLFEVIELKQDEDKKEVEIKEKVIIVGGGIAAVSAADAVRSSNKLAEIEIISKEAFPPYYRTMLTEHLYETMSQEKLTVKKDSWYEEKNIKLTTGNTVASIVPKEKKIVLADGKEMEYDKLVLATGAECFVPPIKNVQLDGVFVIRNLQDTEDVKTYVKKVKSAAVIGGGVLGLEAAWGLKQLGLETSVIEMMERILPRQLDEKGSELLEGSISSSGIKIYKGVKVAQLKGDRKVEGIVLEGGETIPADIVIISAGIAPNKELAVEAGIKTGKGIIVNNRMETSERDIYACGDAAEYEGKVIGLWQVAMEQGKIAGINVCGGNAEYKEQIQPLNFDGMGTKLISIGMIGNSKECEEYVEDIDTIKKVYKKLYFENNKIKGAILIGDVSKGVALMKAVKENSDKNIIMEKIYS